MTEAWVALEIFCPSCGSDIIHCNRPVCDYLCSKCSEEYELKSKKKNFGSKIVDGAYDTMIERLTSTNNPNLFLLSYNGTMVNDFLVIPKHFFIPGIIEKTTPLSKNAKRAHWVGCNILLNDLPEIGKVHYVKQGSIVAKKQILEQWAKTLFLRETDNIKSKGWLLDTMKCIEQLQKNTFALNEIYAFENYLSVKYPNNRHIKDKIRQQLQILRDKGYLSFIGKGRYKVL